MFSTNISGIYSHNYSTAMKGNKTGRVFDVGDMRRSANTAFFFKGQNGKKENLMRCPPGGETL